MTKTHNRRRVERIPLTLPIVGKVDGHGTVMVDVSLLGCRLEHHFPMKVGDRVKLKFDWGEDTIGFYCHVVRCTFSSSSSSGAGLTVYHSGLRFIEEIDGSGEKLTSLLRNQIERALDEQRANARGDVPMYLDNMPVFRGAGVMTANPKEIREVYDKSSTLLPWIRIARERGYVCCRLEKSRWRVIRTREPDQPYEGFTVWAYEESRQIDLLMEAYETGGDDVKKLIRLCAELSLVVDDSIPPQRFLP